MITRVIFPGFSAELAYSTQILVPGQTFSMGVPMLPDVRILTRWYQYFCLGSLSLEAIIDFALVIAAIPGKMVYRLIDLVK